MRLLFLGDTVGDKAVATVCDWAPRLKAEYGLAALIVNCENAANGRGITPEQTRALFAAGVDVLTGGNHSFSESRIIAHLHEFPYLLRPLNRLNVLGQGCCVLELANQQQLAVICVEGKVFLRGEKSCPFAAVQQAIADLPQVSAILVDMHAEATSEKQALAWFFDGRVSAVIGTHTHVPTSDARILPQGTAYLSDAGMSGPYDSIIGMEVQTALTRIVPQLQVPKSQKLPFQVADGKISLCGALLTIDPKTGRALEITTICRS